MEQKGVTVWLTGLSGSGKTTLARALEKRFRELGFRVEVLDGEEVRKDLSRELGFSKLDRVTHIGRIGYLASLLTRHGVTVIVAAISPYREARAAVRKNIGDFVEVYCRCPIEVAESRDVKGVYRKARNGEIKSFTGIDDPYEEPLTPEVVLDTDRETVAQSLEKIWLTLEELAYVPRP